MDNALRNWTSRSMVKDASDANVAQTQTCTKATLEVNKAVHCKLPHFVF